MNATSTRKPSKNEKIDKLMNEASGALAETRYFECDDRAREAFELAAQAQDYDRLGRLLLPLQEARRQIRMQAVDSGNLVVVNEYPALERLMSPDATPESGCYLLEPPLVGADGRNLRDRLRESRIPALVIVHEPQTSLGLWPIVMVGPVTVRTRIEPPDPLDIPWMLEAAEALGDEALASVDPEASAAARVEYLAERLRTLWDHEKLIQAIEVACREADRASKG